MTNAMNQALDCVSEELPKSTLVSRNITVFGRRTSVRLEPEMWNALRDISKREGCNIHDICTLISTRKKAKTSLTAAIRVFLMLYFKAATTEDGHVRAGHGDFCSMLVRARISEDVLHFFSVGDIGNFEAAGRAARRTPMKPYTRINPNSGQAWRVAGAERHSAAQL